LWQKVFENDAFCGIMHETAAEQKESRSPEAPADMVILFILMKVSVFMIIVGIIFLCIFVGLLTLIVRALLKYIHSKDVRQEKSVVRKSLGEALKAHRTQCKMTQEFVAETIGVSRQAVSKWENGTSDPSTSNLFALAKLYGVSVEELLKEVERS